MKKIKFFINCLTFLLILLVASCTPNTGNGSGVDPAPDPEVEETGLAIPANVEVTEGSTKNTVKISWTTTNAAYYWIYYSKTNDSSSAELLEKTSLTYKSISLTESGTYYFWVKSANGYNSDDTSGFSQVVSYEFKFSSLGVPTDVTVAATSTKNTVKISWTTTKAAYYWIYYSKTNDSSSAELLEKTSLTYKSILLTESGTYYFWVKSANGYSSDETSDFSEVAEYDFTLEALDVPTDVTVAATSTKNTVKISWTTTKAAYYWIYYSKTNDSSSAELLEKTSLTYKSISLTESGTYYFWVKSANGYSSDDTSDFSEVASYNFTYGS